MAITKALHLLYLFQAENQEKCILYNSIAKIIEIIDSQGFHLVRHAWENFRRKVATIRTNGEEAETTLLGGENTVGACYTKCKEKINPSKKYELRKMSVADH